MSVPLITIGMTCYNAAGSIERAVRSALAQNWVELEVVVVDDASSDESAALLKALAVEDKRIRLITHAKNKGVAAARNTLVQEARGVFLAFFDDDDVSAPERLQWQYDRIVAYEEQYSKGVPVICHTARTQVYPDGEQRYEGTMGMALDLAPHGPDVALRILTGKPLEGAYGSLATCSQMARTAVYQSLGGFDETLRRGEDTDFAIRAAVSGAHFVGIKEPLVEQTMTLTSDKNLNDEKRFTLRLIDKHGGIVEHFSSLVFCRQWIEAKFDFLQGQRLKFVQKMLGLALVYPKYTAQRLIWAMPNVGFNMRTAKFHDE